MTVFTRFFSSIFWPFEKLISFLFVSAWNMTGNYGVSLLAVSFCITAGTAPLYLLADKWKNGEKAIRGRMQADLDSIKEHYTGSKRFYLMKTAYRLYGYKSWHALRTSFGLLIQIPFFFAAYEVLSGYTGYAGVSFLCIPDLAAGDNLLFDINVLPFVMTAINIVSSFYFTRSRSLRDNSQLLIMAGFFLVLLYDSPSALLVYWTMNNILSLVKAVIFRHTGIQKAPVPDPVSNNRNSFFQRFITHDRDIFIIFLFILCFSLEVFWIQTFKDYFKYAIAITGAGAGVSSLYAVFRRKKYRWIPVHFLLWATLVPFYYLFFANRKYNPYISNVNLKLMIAFIQTLLVFVVPYFFSICKAKPTAHGAVQISILPVTIRQFALILFALAYFLFLYQPLNVYLSSPADIDVTLGVFIGTMMLIVSVITFVGVGISAVVPAEIRRRVTEFVLCALMVSILWSFMFRMNTGMLDNFTFQHEGAIDTIGLLLYVLDPVIVTALLWFARDIIVRKRQSLFPVLVALTLVLTGVLALRLSRMDPATLVQPDTTEAILPESAMENHRFSKTGKNIVFVIADMFNGNYIGRIVEESPEYVGYLEGFTWYPDCLSVSYNTSMSLPAIFGGKQWLPERLNGNDMTGREELAATANNFFLAIERAGYRKTIANPMYFRGIDTGNSRIENIYQYVNYWKKINGQNFRGKDNGKALLPVMLSVFNAVPWHLKSIIYDDANWIIFRQTAIFTQMRKKAIRDMAYISLLPHIASVTEDPGLFLYIHNELPHSPYGIQKDGSLIQKNFPSAGYNDFINPLAAVYSAKKELDLFIDFFSWMKDNLVWDNTMIVLLSDHGNGVYDNEIPTDIDGKGFFTDYDLSRANALLLVKPFAAQGPLQTNWSEVSSADIPALVRKLAGIEFPHTSIAFPPQEKTTRIYSSVVGDWEHGLERDSVSYRTYEVTGPLFNKESWKRKPE